MDGPEEGRGKAVRLRHIFGDKAFAKNDYKAIGYYKEDISPHQ